MDRVIIYPEAIPQDLDLLNTNKNTMVALAMLTQALLGTSTYVDGLTCSPTGPATLTVNVSGGSIYALEEIDATGYGSIGADTTDQIVKQGIIIGTTNFSTPAPVTSGQSVVYLVQAIYQDTDGGGSTVLPYYNASNPSVPYSGPGNDGQPQNTVRQGICHLALKTGVAATTGTQVTPTPDAGYVGLWAITVANGQSTVTSGNIAQLSTAPFISPKLTGMIATVQAGSANFAHDTSGAANTITIALNPAVASLTDGMKVRVKIANSITGATVMNTNALGNVSVVTPSGAALTTGTLVANGLYDLTYDANGTRWVYDGSGNLANLTNNVFAGGTTTGSANAQALSSVSPASTTFTNGQSIVCTAGFTNTGSATFQAPGGSALTIKEDSGSGLVALTGGEITAGDTIILTYNLAGTCWVLTAGFPLGTAAYKTASDNTKTTVASVSGSTTAGHVLVAADTAGTAKDGGAPNTYQALPSNPTGTTSTSGVMMGLAGAFTPTRSGKVLIIVSGDIQNSSGSDYGTVQLYYGTGTAPTNGAALTGTAVSGKVNGAVDGTHPVPFSMQAIVSGLTLSTAIWIDIAVAAVSGGTATTQNISISAVELL